MARRLPPAPLLFVLSAISQYTGAAIAVIVFRTVPAAGVAWLRIAIGAVVMILWRRPWRRLPRLARREAALLVAFGVALAAMNLTFYLAIARLPVGTTVAIEFIGPISVAAAAGRSPRDGLALVLAVAGILCLSSISLGHPLGVLLALAAGVGWALYILLGYQVARRGLGTQGLAAAMAVGTLAVAPVGIPLSGPAWGSPAALAECGAVALCSSVLPYALDQVILKRLARGTYALLLSLLPATATAVAALVLRQIPRPLELLGIGLVVAAVALRSPEPQAAPAEAASEALQRR